MQMQAFVHRDSEKQSRTLSRPSFLPISLLSPSLSSAAVKLYTQHTAECRHSFEKPQ
uniref:Uncharacterized protein n=1 Tax=Arundo donax TaxID=35708 RepID=A0A0A9F3E9_ARUDO